MEWGITNRGKDAIRFQLALSPEVRVSEANSEDRVVLNEGKEVLTIEGMHSATNAAGGKILVTDIGAATARRLRLQAGLASVHAGE